MGTGTSFICDDCNKEIEVMEGVGMRRWPIEELKKEFPKKVLFRIEQLEKESELKHYGYFYALFVCPECKTIKNKIQINLTYKNGQVIETEYKCSKCKSKMEIKETEDELPDLKCRKCGGHLSKSGMFMLWD